MNKTTLSGLSAKQAEETLLKIGPNELRHKNDLGPVKILLSQFTSPLVYILVVAALVTFLLGDHTDAVVIFLAVFLNTILGFYQEQKAQKALVALSNLLEPKAKVIRDGKQQLIDAKLVVPGDICILTLGGRIPADGVLIKATDFSVNEAILTGESLPVKKKQGAKSLAFAGTMVVSGIARIRVTATGMQTEIGKIGKGVTLIEEQSTPLQLQLARLANTLAIIVGAITVVIFTLGRLAGYPLIEMFTTSVAVAVAAIPEGLVVTVTVILALGMQRILKRRAIVRKLVAAETLGSVNLIASDKTGTLTEGKMKVVRAEFTDLKLGQQAAVLCNDLRDPLEVSMWQWAIENGVDTKELQSQKPRLAEIPFSPDYKMIATLHPELLLVSGAPEVILGNCKISKNEKEKWLKKFAAFGNKGYRLVGFAFKQMPVSKKKINLSELTGLSWLGVLVYEDPIRPGVKEALRQAQKAGIEVKVITGDYLSTAQAVLRKLGIETKDCSIEGQVLSKEKGQAYQDLVKKTVLFARTSPEEKLTIVQALQSKGGVVAMTGDGVNDAPALKAADIGIVVNDASDVSKQTADIVLLDSNFATIVAAVKEGRVIFENIKKVVLYLLSHSFTEVILIGGTIVLGLPLPVTAVQILWVNLVEDSLPAIALAYEPEEGRVMEQPPRSKNAPILDGELRFLIFFIGLSLDITLLGLFYYLNQGLFHLQYIQTVMFAALAIDSPFICLASRSLKKSALKINFFANRFLLFSLLVSFLLLFAAIYWPPLQVLLDTHPLGIYEWIFLFGLGLLNFAAIEIAKWFFLIRHRQ